MAKGGGGTVFFILIEVFRRTKPKCNTSPDSVLCNEDRFDVKQRVEEIRYRCSYV